MTGIGELPAAGAGGAAAETVGEKTRIRDAARQFESVLIGQMLRSMRQGGGWLGTGEDATSESIMELAEQQFAQVLATKGGLGLASLVVEGLSRKAETASRFPPAGPDRADKIPIESLNADHGLPPPFLPAEGSRACFSDRAAREPGTGSRREGR